MEIKTQFQQLDLYFRLDKEGNISFFNGDESIFSPIHTSTLVGKNITEILPSELCSLLLTNINCPKPTYFETTMDNKWIEISIYPSKEETSIFFRDLTAKKEVEKALQENHKRIILLSEASNEIISKEKPKEILDTLFNKLSHYLDLDVYFNYMFGENRHQLRLMNYKGIPQKNANSIEWLDFGQAVCGWVAKDKKRMVVENIARSTDPKVELIKSLGIKSYVCHPLMSYGKLIGTLSFGSKSRNQFNHDEIELIQKICNQIATTLERLFIISELKRKNVELNETNKQLIEAKDAAEKANRAKSNFLSMVSHELRTPLNSILGYTQILLSDTKEVASPNQEKKINKILAASRHLLTLINDILDLVRIENGKPKIKIEPITLYTAIEESVKFIRHYADSKNINILCEYNNLQKQSIDADQTRLSQVIINLLSNAIKYNDPGQQITIECHKQETDIIISIYDNGFGIDPGDIDKIFEPFFRSPLHSAEVDGNGIGLALVKQLTTEMGGTYGVKSHLGSGSQFWIKFPCARSNDN